MGKAWAVGVAVLVVGGVGCAAADDAETDRFGAALVCQDFVADRLRAPGTADHPRVDEAAIIQVGDEYIYESFVDAENGFGGEVRTGYRCVVRLDGDTWRLQSLTFDE